MTRFWHFLWLPCEGGLEWGWDLSREDRAGPRRGPWEGRRGPVGEGLKRPKWMGCGAAWVRERCPGLGLDLGMKILRPDWDTLDVRPQGGLQEPREIPSSPT